MTTAHAHAGARELRTLLDKVVRDAAERSVATIEAEHLLIALAELPASDGGEFLLAHGLDRGALDVALAAERRHSLERVGAPVIADEHLNSTLRSRRSRWGASARDALDRGMRLARGHQGSSTLPVVAGVLLAELGTVPRMLSLAGFDQHRLLGLATASLANR